MTLFPYKASDTLGDFIRRSRRSAKIAWCARCSDCDFRRSPRSAYKIADIWHVRYGRLNSPAFAKCARSRDFLRSLLRIASKANPSGWAILPHDFKNCHIAAIGEKNRQVCPHQSVAKIACDFRWRSKSPGSAYKFARCVACFKPATHLAILYADRRDWRKSPGVPGAAIAIFADRRDRRIKSPISGMSDIGHKIRLHSPNVPVPVIFYARCIKSPGVSPA